MTKQTNDIDKLFMNILEILDCILTDDFYIENNNLSQIRQLIETWYDDFKIKNTLLTMRPEKIEFIDLEITDLFDCYIESESPTQNYSERLLYYFGNLEKKWKEEMLGGN